MTELHAAFDDPSTHAEAIDIPRSLIDRVDIRHDADGFTIALTGAIMNMVKLLPGAETAGTEPYASSVKMVAGAGFNGWHERAVCLPASLLGPCKFEDAEQLAA